MVQSTCQYHRGPKFGCQHPHAGLQPLVIPGPGHLILSSGLLKHPYTCIHTHTGAGKHTEVD